MKHTLWFVGLGFPNRLVDTFDEKDGDGETIVKKLLYHSPGGGGQSNLRLLVLEGLTCQEVQCLRRIHPSRSPELMLCRGEEPDSTKLVAAWSVSIKVGEEE